MATEQVLPIIRHLPEADDLRDERDGEVLPGQEDAAMQIATELLNVIDLKGAENLTFIHSPKKRAKTTAQMTEKFLTELNPGIHVQSHIEPNIKDIHHGVYKLPKNYQPGDFYEGFGLADKIFYGEVFDNYPDVENLLYHYGDPCLQPDGTYRYPELSLYFSGYGENFRDVLIRIYSEVAKFTVEYRQHKPGSVPVMFSHGLPLEIYKDLSEVSQQIVTTGFSFPSGKLARICYNHHRARNSEEGSHGRVDILDLQYLSNPAFLAVLQAELQFLRDLSPGVLHRIAV